MKVYKIKFPPLSPLFWFFDPKGGTAERSSASCEREPPRPSEAPCGELQEQAQLTGPPEAHGEASKGPTAPWGASGASRRSTGLLGASTGLPSPEVGPGSILGAIW